MASFPSGSLPLDRSAGCGERHRLMRAVRSARARRAGRCGKRRAACLRWRVLAGLAGCRRRPGSCARSTCITTCRAARSRSSGRRRPARTTRIPTSARVPPGRRADVAAQQRIADRLAPQRDRPRRPRPRTRWPPRRPAAASRQPPPRPTRTPTGRGGRRARPPAPRRAAAAARRPARPPSGRRRSRPRLGGVPAVPAAVASGPLPTLAAAPPPLPPGASASLAAPLAAAPAGRRAAAPAPAAAGASVVFTPGSAALPPSAPLNLRRFALAHQGVPAERHRPWRRRAARRRTRRRARWTWRCAGRKPSPRRWHAPACPPPTCACAPRPPAGRRGDL